MSINISRVILEDSKKQNEVKKKLIMIGIRKKKTIMSG